VRPCKGPAVRVQQQPVDWVLGGWCVRPVRAWVPVGDVHSEDCGSQHRGHVERDSCGRGHLQQWCIR